MLPTRLPRDLLPTTFLPQLPRSKTTLEPLSTVILLGHIGILRELYIPPIHGGFQATDVGHDSDVQVDRRTKVRARRFSASLTDTMDSLGLGLDLDLESAGDKSASATGSSTLLTSAIVEENEQEGSEGDEASDEEETDGDSGGEEAAGHLDPFEREWAEKWLNGVVRRAQTWIEEHDEDAEGQEAKVLKEMEAILRDSTAVLAMMAGTSAAGSLTRHLLFPVHHSLAPGLKAMQSSRPVDPSLSPTTTSFLASLATFPVSPIIPFRPTPRNGSSDRSGQQHSPESSHRQRAPSSPSATRRRKRSAVPILLHDAPMQDHVSVGVQTWGSAILLGREMSLNPSDFGLFPGPSTPSHRGVRVLELGAGTGLLGILCRKLLDLRMASPEIDGDKYPGLVVATDYHHDVLANLKVCVDLNFPPRVPTATGGVVATKVDHEDDGVKIAKLDWTTFPAYMTGRKDGQMIHEEDNADVGQHVGEPFDLVLASDCVYDPTHAKLLRDVAGWVLRLPDHSIPGDIGGTMHLLSPIRPTFTPELESIDVNFPTLASYRPLAERQSAAGQNTHAPSALSNDVRGEGLGLAQGLKLGVRGEGKRSVKGRKGEGRVDEVAGYWWWEVGWG